MQSLLNINVQILAEVREGSLISLDECALIEKQLGLKLDWEQVESLNIDKYFQGLYATTIPYYLAMKINPDLLGRW